MQPFPVSKKILIIVLLLSLSIITFNIFQSFNDRSTKIVFCNVGQGDAAYIRINNQFDILIDAGPDRKVLDCLGKYMPFFDRKIELAFLSHPNNDHYNGYFFIADRYQIDKFITVKSLIVSKTYKKLIQKISDKKIPILYKLAGEKIRVKNGEFMFFWPPKNFMSSSDNDYSQVLLFQENNFKVLFTGDASPVILNKIISYVGANFNSPETIQRNAPVRAWRDMPQHLNILKVPHHGSKNGLTESIIKYLRPEIAVISVGKNSYGHPSKSVLGILNKYSVKIRRTDREGNVVFKISN